MDTISKIKSSKTLVLNSKEGKEVLWEQAILQIEKEIEKVFWNFFFLMQTSHMFSVVKYWRRTRPEFYESKAGSKLSEGQLISKGLFDVIVLTKKKFTEIF